MGFNRKPTRLVFIADFIPRLEFRSDMRQPLGIFTKNHGCTVNCVLSSRNCPAHAFLTTHYIIMSPADPSHPRAISSINSADSECLIYNYRRISNISRTKYQNLNEPRLVFHLSLPNPLKPDVKWRMKM